MSVVRRVRLELPLLLHSPQKEELEALPYSSWLKNHAEEMMALVDDNGEQLLKGVRSISGIVDEQMSLPGESSEKVVTEEIVEEQEDSLPAVVAAIDSMVLPDSTTAIAEVPAKRVFVTDFCFISEEALDYYNFNYMQTMKGRIVESYPSAMDVGSPFKYKFGIRGIVDPEDFKALGNINSDDVSIVVMIGNVQ